MKNEQDWKDRLSFAYSTNPEYKPEEKEEEPIASLNPSQQNLIVAIERKNRGGKTVTVVRNFVGSEEDLDELGKKLKSKCGVGGSAKNGEILIQGEIKQKVAELLKEWGYKVKISG